MLCCTWKGFPPHNFYLPPQYVQIQDQPTESWPKEQLVCLFGRNRSGPEAAPSPDELITSAVTINNSGPKFPAWMNDAAKIRKKKKSPLKSELKEVEILTLVSFFFVLVWNFIYELNNKLL